MTDVGSAAQRDRRRRILAVTTAMASEGGFDAVQMRAVADRADVALGTLYRYFPSKVHLLVSVLAHELERLQESPLGGAARDGTPHDRVMQVLAHGTRVMQQDPLLTEALTRAFMFADAGVSDDIRRVVRLVTDILTAAMLSSPDGGPPSDDDAAVARVIGDVWLSSLVGWVTGRTTAADVERSLDVATRLLLR